jgi:hypothetical protein
MKKTLTAIIASMLILITFIGPISVFTAQGQPSGDYMTVPGVLATDTYLLYPFETDESLTIGFSKYGEMINTEENIGLQYGEVDPFAPPAGSPLGSINKEAWLQGWLCNVTYYHRIRGELRNVWATAQHADAVAFGNPWIRVDFVNDWDTTYGYEDPRDPGFIQDNYAAGNDNHGGRKTNGTMVTEDIRVLYDGPRKFVALLVSTLSDHFISGSSTTEDIPLVEIRYTIVFNKVKKEVILFKDIKTLVHEKYADGMKVQFSNRGEVDLGTESDGYTSYFHFYTQGVGGNGTTGPEDVLVEGMPTVYDSDWVLDPTEDPYNTAWANYSASGPYPQSMGATFDVAQAINPQAGYVWWAAFWPSLNDWTIDGWPMWWRSMQAQDPHDDDASFWATPPRTEPSIPYYIGEWDSVLRPIGKQTQQMYRYVTVYGVTDWNDGDDADMYETNVIDREVKYQLDEVFNPWDLGSAVHKDTQRWVEFTYGTSWTSDNRPVMDVSDYMWDQYCVFSERVIDLTTGELLNRWEGDYEFWVDSNGWGHITGLLSTHYYKILYSTDTWYSEWGNVPFSWTDYNITVAMMNSGYVLDETYWTSMTDPLGATHELIVDELTLSVVNNTGLALEGDQTWTFDGTMDFYEEDFKVFKEGQTVISCYWWDQGGPAGGRMFDHEATNGGLDFYFGNFWMFWRITPPAGLDLHVDWLHLDVDYDITVFYNATTSNFTVTTMFDVNGGGGSGLPYVLGPWTNQLYVEHIPGRYEWVTVGRDAASVDSAGASLVTAAFKNKQVEIGLASVDMFDPMPANQCPWVMHKYGTGDVMTDYHYDHAGGDHRTAVKDDWCTTWPIASSNMIGVGGPLANLLSQYGNDFTEAFFGWGLFTDDAMWENNIDALSCWNKNAYASTDDTGYAVVSTYKDINGTVLFLIWGHWGRDTFYVSQWFHEHGIFQLQDAPDGLTSIIVEIEYEDTEEGYKPDSFTIVELLGTISETEWSHGYIKGGIHDP